MNVAPSYEGGRLNRPAAPDAPGEYFITPRPVNDLNDGVDEVNYDDEAQRVEDIPHETEEETLSLEAKEKEMIMKALKKHHNKRKYAAHDLGISERTLYRKLKQYDLEQL